MLVFFILALVGLVLTAIAHFSTYAGFDPLESLPYVWILYVGIFVVFIPGLSIAALQPRDQNGNFQPLRFAPRWMQRLMSATALYAFINFIIFVVVLMTVMHQATPELKHGQYVLSGHRYLQTITAAQYHRYHGFEFRAISGITMLFYLFALTALASGIGYRMLTIASAPSEEGPAGRPGRLPWVYVILTFIIHGLCFLAGPVLYITFVKLFGWRVGGFGIVVIFTTPIIGLVIAQQLMKKLPAKCSNCGGRLIFRRLPGYAGRLMPIYQCPNCGWSGG